jgi:hypothetical protein
MSLDKQVVVFLEFGIVNHDEHDLVGPGSLLTMRPKPVDFFSLDVAIAWEVVALTHAGALGVDLASYIPETIEASDGKVGIALRLTGLTPHAALKVAEENVEEVPDIVKAALAATRATRTTRTTNSKLAGGGTRSAARSRSVAPRAASGSTGTAAGSASGSGAAAGAADAGDADDGAYEDDGEDEDYLDPEERAEWLAAARVCQVAPPAAPAAAPAAGTASGSVPPPLTLARAPPLPLPAAPAAPPPLPPPPAPPLAPGPVMVNGWAVLGEQRLGRINYLWRSPTSSQMMVYCKRHGCYTSIAGSKNPFESGAVKWLSYGWSPECPSKADHMAEFKRFVMTP